MKLRRMWIRPVALLLVVVGTLGCGERPQNPAPQVGRDAAIEEIRVLGGKYRCKRDVIVYVDLHDTEITDAGLERLVGLTGLQELLLMGTPITDAGLEHLKGLTNLEGLYLTTTQITDAGVKHLGGLTHLQSLDLHDTGVTDAGLEHLKGLTNLENLYLEGTQVTDAGVKDLKNSLPDVAIAR